MRAIPRRSSGLCREPALPVGGQLRPEFLVRGVEGVPPKREVDPLGPQRGLDRRTVVQFDLHAQATGYLDPAPGVAAVAHGDPVDRRPRNGLAAQDPLDAYAVVV